MKHLALTCLALVTFSVATAQTPQQNVIKESKTTVTTVKDSDGEHQVKKTATTSSVQNLEFENAESNKLNKDLIPTPIEQQTTITVTTPDGKTRQVDQDRSAKYVVNNVTYEVGLDNVGYSILESKTKKKVGVLRHLGYNTYLVDVNGKHAYASFDPEGNLVVRRYDSKSDQIIDEKYMKE